jgi:hypothetical protein
MSPNERLILLSIGAVVLMALAAWILYKVRTTPAERERRRRMMVNRVGRMRDGLLRDVDETTVYYSYTAGGVDYDNSQDVSELAEYLPEDRNSLIGTVTLKYAPRNAANSIVICEDWSGLRSGADRTAESALDNSVRA